MDLRELQLFSHLASSLHFGKTANALHVSPPTLSRVIQRLEDECGATLFNRNNRTVELTHAGEKLLVFATSVLSDWHNLKQELNMASEQLSGVLTIFCSVTASQSHLPALLSRFREQHGLVDFKLETGDPGIAVQKVLDGACDMAIAINSPDLPAELSFNHLDSVPLVLVVPRSENVSQISDIDWREMPVIMPESGPTRRTVHHWFAESGVRPHIYASVGGNEAIVSMVALGCGIGFVPRLVIEHSSMAAQVKMIEVNNIEPYQLGLCCLASRRKEPLISAMLQQLDS